MNIYLVRNKDGKYLFIRRGQLISWGAMQDATVYNYHQRAYEGGMHAFQWGDDAEEKFDIVDLVASVARDVTDSAPLTKDGKPISPGNFYWKTHKYGVESVRVNEISTTYYSDPKRIEFYCLLDSGVWLPPESLYSTEPLAWVAWKEEQ